jgi:hypothetical protein
MASRLSLESDYARIDEAQARRNDRCWPIVLQKSKIAADQISGQHLKRKAIADSYSLSRATEVAYEFSVRR